MPIYISKDNQQSGPYEDHVVIEQLRNGILSPSDMGIRHGEAAWQRLGEMFPGVAATSPTPPIAPVESMPQAARNVVSAEAPAAKGGGCAPIAGIILMIFGLLMLLSGVGGGIANRVIESPSCEIADKYEREMNEAVKAAEAAKGTPREAELQAEALDKIESAEVWTRGCAETQTTQMMFLAGFLVVAAVGFLFVIVGFFLRRRRSA